MLTVEKRLEGELSGHRLTFDVLVEEIKTGDGDLLCENYGLRVTRTGPDGNEETAEVSGITVSDRQILSLFHRITAGDVTPAILRDVVEDFLNDPAA